jgi:hypothetical protein
MSTRERQRQIIQIAAASLAEALASPRHEGRMQKIRERGEFLVEKIDEYFSKKPPAFREWLRFRRWSQ